MPLSIATVPGASGGANLDRPKNMIRDEEAYIIQDAFVSQPDFLTRRGPVKIYSGSPTITYTPWGMVSINDPEGTNVTAVLHGYSQGTSTFSILSSAHTAWDVQIPLTINPETWPPIISIAPAVGGVMIGWSGKYDFTDPDQQGIIYWGGGARDDYTCTISYVQKELSDVTGSGTAFLTEVTSGMWMFDGAGVLIGQVKSVDSNTALTLVGGATKTISSGSATFQTLRGVTNTPHVMTGRITSADNTDRVQGGDTKFTKQLAADGKWNIFRWWDFNWDGIVDEIASDIGLTYQSTSAHDNFDEEYVGIWFDARYEFDFDENTSYGWISTEYAGRHWYANLGQIVDTDHLPPGAKDKTYRLWFSHPQNPEALDTTTDGDWFDVRSSSEDNKPIRGLAPTHNSMLVYKEDETFAVFGASPDSFSVQRVHDDGLWSPMTIQQYKGGVLWAGKRGVYYYDGATITNLLDDKAALAWQKGLMGKNPDTEHMWSMLHKQHYFVHFVWNSPVSLIRASSSETPNEWTLCLNLETGAITFASNLRFRGSVSLPGSFASNKDLFVVPTSATTTGKICRATDLFDSTGDDNVTTYGSAGTATAGPAFYMESKSFDAGDPIRLKRWRQLTFYYLASGGAISIDTVLGLNTTGVTLSTSLANSSGLWQAARARFGKKSQFFGFRLYEADSSLTDFKLGPYQLEFKPERPERVSN